VRYLEDPRQSELFDVFADILSPVAYRRLHGSWQHLFRCAILKLMPAGKLAEHFDPQIGRPTNELYSLMATAIRRFLVQVKRHDEDSDNTIRESVRRRYEASSNAIFGWKTLDDEGVNALRQSVAAIRISITC